MEFWSRARRSVFWRGLHYFKNGCVKEIKRIDDTHYIGKVQGSELYEVNLDVEHPIKSTCNCPFAKDNSKICKHKIAMYFKVFPEKAQPFIEELEESRRRKEEFDDLFEKELALEEVKLRKEIANMSNKEVREAYFNMRAIEMYDFIYQRCLQSSEYYDEDYEYDDYYEEWD